MYEESISYETFRKRFGQETKLCLTNGVPYNAWHVDQKVISEIAGSALGRRKHDNVYIIREQFSALFYNPSTRDKLVLIAK